MATVLLSILFFSVFVGIMTVGVVFSGRCMRGSCGGEGVVGADGERLTCDTCPRRKEKDTTRS